MSLPDINALLDASASFDLLLTLLTYQLGLWLYTRSGGHPLLLPVWVGLVLVILALSLLGRSYSAYAANSALLMSLLGPVIVALAVPLYEHSRPMRQQSLRIVAICGATSVVTAGAVWLLVAQLAGGDPTLAGSLLPKAATTAIAIEIAASLGGIPALAAITVMLTGIVGGILGPGLLRRVGVTDDAAVGLALGVSAHAVGTARAFEISPRCGAWAALGMSLTGVLLALTLPLLGPLTAH
ncbi:MAG: LrgB family protein [Oceanococcaceae bacterium]